MIQNNNKNTKMKNNKNQIKILKMIIQFKANQINKF